jgi:hypothetical protein
MFRETLSSIFSQRVLQIASGRWNISVSLYLGVFGIPNPAVQAATRLREPERLKLLHGELDSTLCSKLRFKGYRLPRGKSSFDRRSPQIPLLHNLVAKKQG